MPQASLRYLKENITTEGELVSPEGTQEGKNTCQLAAIRLQPLPTVSHEKIKE